MFNGETSFFWRIILNFKLSLSDYIFSGATAHTNNSFQYLFRKSPNLQQFATICFGFPKKSSHIGVGRRPFSNRCGEKLEPPYTCACDDNCQFFGDCCQDFRWFDGFIRFMRLFHYYTPFTGRPVVKSSFSRSCKTSTACSSALVGHNLIINYYNMLVIRCTLPGTS